MRRTSSDHQGKDRSSLQQSSWPATLSPDMMDNIDTTSKTPTEGQDEGQQPHAPSAGGSPGNSREGGPDDEQERQREIKAATIIQKRWKGHSVRTSDVKLFVPPHVLPGLGGWKADKGRVRAWRAARRTSGGSRSSSRARVSRTPRTQTRARSVGSFLLFFLCFLSGVLSDWMQTRPDLACPPTASLNSVS